MFAKGIIAAGILAASLAFMPETAAAKTVVKVGVNGGWVNGCWASRHRHCGWRHNWHYGWRYRHYNPRIIYYSNVYDPGPSRLDCRDAADLLRDSGFSKIRPTDCAGKYLSFKARRAGHYFVLRVNSWTGNIVVVARH